MRTIILSILVLTYCSLFAQKTSKNVKNNNIITTKNLIISGIGDGPLFNGTPKFVELYVKEDIADLSVYGLETINNGTGIDGIEFTFPPLSAKAGSYLYLTSDAARFRHWFKFTPDYLVFSVNVNGNDAVALYENQSVIDVFGAVGKDGTGTAWEYTNGFAYRKNDTTNAGNFNSENWVFSGVGAWTEETDNASAAIPFPAGELNLRIERDPVAHFINQEITSTKEDIKIDIQTPACEEECCSRGRYVREY